MSKFKVYYPNMNSETPIVKRPENKKNRTPIFGIWNKEHIILFKPYLQYTRQL